VIAGAVGAAALSLVLFLLGAGLGLAVASPWAGEGMSGTSATVSTILWITFVSIMASVLGGYLAGRLRSRWSSVHTDEVFFRDTAHGFLAWALSTLLMATLMSSAVGSALSAGAKAGGEVVKAAATATAAGAGAAVAGADKTGGAGAGPMGYFVDSLMRGSPGNVATSNSTTPTAASAVPIADHVPEVTRIFTNALQSGQLPDADRQYLGQLVSAQTGIPAPEAEQRVTDTFTALKQNLDQAAAKAKQVADDARKASAGLALWLVVSLLIGAFVAAFAATLGGRLRDSSVLVKA